MFVYLERFSNNQVSYLEHVFWASRDYKRMNRVLCKRLSTKYTRLVNVPSQKYTCFINAPLQKYKCFVKDLLQKVTGFASEKSSSHDMAHENDFVLAAILSCLKSTVHLASFGCLRISKAFFLSFIFEILQNVKYSVCFAKFIA